MAIAPVPGDLIVNKTGAVLDSLIVLSCESQETRMYQREMREGTNG